MKIYIRKSPYLILLLLLPNITLLSQEVYIPDSNFLAALIEADFDLNDDGIINKDEAEAVHTLLIEEREISDLTGINAFINLQQLNCNGNILESLDLSANNDLFFLNCSDNKLDSLDLSSCPNIQQVRCSNNQLSFIDVSLLENLYTLECQKNNIEVLYLTQNTKLITLNCSENQLTELDISMCDCYGMVNCSRNNLTILKYNEDIQYLDCSNNSLTELELSGMRDFRTLDCGFNQLESLVFEYNGDFEKLICPGNNLKVLDISKCPRLLEVHCFYNELESLNLTANRYLTTLRCSSNRLDELDVSSNPDLYLLAFPGNDVKQIDLTNNLRLRQLIISQDITELDVSNAPDLRALECQYSKLSTLDISSNTKLDFLDLDHMPGLFEICIWQEDFPPPGSDIQIQMSHSPNAYFTANCSGYSEPIVLTNRDTISTEVISVSSNREGTVYLVPMNTVKDIDSIVDVQYMYVQVKAYEYVDIDVSGLSNGAYYLYARDMNDELSNASSIIIQRVYMEAFSKEHFNIFPNPSNGIIRISGLKTGQNIEVYSLTGKIIFSKQYKDKWGLIDITQYPSGLYIISVDGNHFKKVLIN